jgi:hypothetical protein
MMGMHFKSEIAQLELSDRHTLHVQAERVGTHSTVGKYR